MPNRIIETFAVLGLFVLIVITKWSGVRDNSTLITIGAFMAAAYKIIPGIVKIINATGQMKTYEFSIFDKESIANKDKEVFKENSADDIENIQFKNISFQYDDLVVLNNFYMSINKGDFIGITGKSGKGKTTILNLLLGFLEPSKGEIIINNRSVSTLDLKHFWPLISYVRQQPFFIHDSVIKNITFQEHNYEKEKLDFALKNSGLKDFINQSPEGLDKMITENGKNISGGQQQRIAIARALYKNADIILLDEPFNELDEASADILTQNFKNMAMAGKTIVMITHDSKCLAYCNKIISLDAEE
jgi:ABC-type bacteriocin/lantibiotic exporter with double-glycine peptidase domain